MDEAWERAVEAALDGQAVDSSSPPRALTLDGAVKCLQGRLPPPELLERYQSLEHLSIASVGVSSLVTFPRLRNLRRLILSDNRIAGGLEFLVEAGLDSLRDLDLSNNRIQFLDDLAPLARLRLVSLDLYECPVTRVRDYRTKVFAMIRSLKYLDKMDADENERPETDDEDDEEEEDEEEEDPGSGEIDGEDRTGKVTNGVVGTTFADGIVGVDEDDESDADEEVETVRTEANGLARGFHHHHLSNGFRVAAVGEEDGEEDEEEAEEDVEYDDVNGDDANENLAEEIDEDDGEDEGVVEVHDIAESDEDVDEMEEEEEIEVQDGDEVDGDGDEDEEDVDDEEEDGEPVSTARMTSTDGEIDGHDQGEEDENENGEIGEEDEERAEELNFEEDDEGEDEEEDLGGDYLLQQHVDQVEVDAGGSDFDACNGEDEDGVDDNDNDNAVVDDRRNNDPSSSSHPSKRKRGGEDDVNEDDCVEDSRSSKHR